MQSLFYYLGMERARAAVAKYDSPPNHPITAKVQADTLTDFWINKDSVPVFPVSWQPYTFYSLLRG